MQRNSGKCYLILSTNEPAQIQTRQSLIESTNCKKLGGVKIDSKLSFDKHIKTICKKASNKLRALARVTPYMAIERKNVLMNSFADSQFDYCPLVWMCQDESVSIHHKKIQALATKMYKVKSGYTSKIFTDLFNKRGISPCNLRRHP